ncbi:YeeE/YedE family protein [Profundibacterium mesophilum]|uniref:Seryl-tRNA synthetase n=1 Tax=Profundibacterium mesophilum KAUST100406-0324 TaxID=1037889 RepID=A0A921TG81_9RHOB|nr:YeeE/YedE family protein [Profundibacterium mesophilum]KAF0677189.1 seryl-tRNA synthetase [Profundibacterium mesophilum KAUST100406-0324]
MKQLFALLCGLIFGFGLIISGMSDPAKVLNFLDVFGSWDPSLAFVIGGAVAVSAPGLAWVTRSRRAPFFGDTFHLPTRTDLDPNLLTGAAIFGIGWGLGGFCPGPALTALPIAASGTLVFVPFMLGGMYLARHTPDLALLGKKGLIQ